MANHRDSNKIAVFKPSDVILKSLFMATFDRMENEIAAAMVVRALAVRGDTWRAIALTEIGACLKEALAEKREPRISLKQNPFTPPPDMMALVNRGWAAWYRHPPQGSIYFTADGLERLCRWVRKT